MCCWVGKCDVRLFGVFSSLLRYPHAEINKCTSMEPFCMQYLMYSTRKLALELLLSWLECECELWYWVSSSIPYIFICAIQRNCTSGVDAAEKWKIWRKLNAENRIHRQFVLLQCCVHSVMDLHNQHKYTYICTFYNFLHFIIVKTVWKPLQFYIFSCNSFH